MKRKLPRMFAAITLLATSCTLTACSSENIPTCSEFASMNDSTGLFSGLNAEQNQSVKAALKSQGLDDRSGNMTLAQYKLLAYCNISEGVANANRDELITEAL